MQELRLVGSSDDGSAVLLVDDSGATYRLSLDDRLRVLVRRPAAAVASRTSAARAGAALSPREIQARIRAGESADDVAATTGVPVEKVRRYEGPVLAERGHVATNAQRAAVRRSTGETGSVDGSAHLGDAVTNRLESRGVLPDDVTWDAWRREDGRWTIRADFPLVDGHASAEFVFDVMSRYSVPGGDGARWVLGEQPAPPEQVRQFVPRLAAVGAEDAWPERGQRPDRPERPTGSGPWGERPFAGGLSGPAAHARPLPASAADSTPDRPHAGGNDGKLQTEESRGGFGRSDLDAAGISPDGGGGGDGGDGGEATPTGPAEAEPMPPTRRAEVEPAPPTGAAEAERVPPTSRVEGKRTTPGGRTGAEPTGRRKRAAVPAWDDILFGGRQPE